MEEAVGSQEADSVAEEGVVGETRGHQTTRTIRLLKK